LAEFAAEGGEIDYGGILSTHDRIAGQIIIFLPTLGMESKVIIEQRQLRGSKYGDALQLIATVYLSGEEYRIYVPAKATGDALDWLDNSCIRQSDGIGEVGVVTPYKHASR
jgi:hypothetical protein